MQRTTFNSGWKVRPARHLFAELMGPKESAKEVRLPHDAMWDTQQRSPEGNPAIAFFPEAEYDYTKSFFVPEEHRGKSVFLEFEGAYSRAEVFINGELAAERPYGYSHFYVKVDRYLNYGSTNEVKVSVRNYKDSRWYSGAGLYRPIWLIVAHPVHVAPDGIRVSTPDVDARRAVVCVATTVQHDGTGIATVSVRTEIIDANGRIVARDEAPLTTVAGEDATLHQKLYVRSPSLWSVDAPYLYTCRTTLYVGDEQIDEEFTTFGIRTLSLDPEDGLRINGEVVKLRGACIHHDNGILGAATFDRAEERRVETLKAAGFNALRSAHHPMSKALLAACDRLGMLVMDECFDMWTIAKNPYDYSLDFPEWWQRDVEAMVAKDYNHPCVIMYSIGNEIPETGSPIGTIWGRRIAEHIRALDDTRFVTIAINPLVSIMDELIEQRRAMSSGEEWSGSMTFDAAEMMAGIAVSESATRRTAEAFACVDVAGYNYAWVRYKMDLELFPNRIIVGTESFPGEIDRIWHSVQEHSHVIGDFTWTGWDYLGEVGIGRVIYDPSELASGFQAGYPWLTAWCGDIDITGYRRPASYYREIVFGLRREPYIAVERPEHHGRHPLHMGWGWPDVVPSWTWPGWEGRPIRVEVYADAEEVELLQNGRSLGRVPAGETHRYRAEFDTVYEPGELVAVAYSQGQEIGRAALRSAHGPVRLHVEADRREISALDGDLAFVTIELVDEEGNLYSSADRRVWVRVEGAGVLQGLGSANPITEESFLDPEHSTFDGRALAVIRPTSPGTITVTAGAEGCEPRSLEITVKEL